MDARLQQRIQRYGWDRAAPVYQEAWQDQLAPAQRLLLEMAAPARGEAVLDVACGTGLVSLPAAQAVGPSGRVLGCDISGAMVEAAAEAATAAGLTQAEFRRVAGEDLAFAPAEGGSTWRSAAWASCIWRSRKRRSPRWPGRSNQVGAVRS